MGRVQGKNQNDKLGTKRCHVNTFSRRNNIRMLTVDFVMCFFANFDRTTSILTARRQLETNTNSCKSSRILRHLALPVRAIFSVSVELVACGVPHKDRNIV